ncbi:MAG: bifunctional nicotinamidase/pyrazinamidase [Gemmatimonadetes bacterium]|nr:bifunctional nicotinamidase/pyrazinamidase [Gemmatimonadota bacterium]
MATQSALLVVDVQNDFCPGGALAVPEGDRVVPVLNDYIARFREAGVPVYASRDWHPRETRHFKAWGGKWPPHCIQDTRGAQFHAELRLPKDAVIVSKGMDPEQDAYSAFQAQDANGAALEQSLRQRGVQRLYVGGLATDYCVRASTLDALKQGFQAVLLLDAVKGIDLEPGDIARSIDEMVRSGARTATLASIEQEIGTGAARS